MKLRARLTLAAVLLAAAVPARAGEVKLSFSNGRVTIVATDASPRQILVEWAKLGQVRITNLDRLAGGPVTLQLTNVPEAQALETVLRGTAGYVAAPRAELTATGSCYDRILLLPGVAPTLPVVSASAPAAATPGFGRGRPSGIPTFDTSADDESESFRPAPMPGNSRPGPNGPQTPGQAVMPGMLRQPPVGYPGSTTQAPGTAQPAAQPGFNYSNGNQQQSPTGTSVPGMFTAPSPLPTTPYSTDGQSGRQADQNTASSPVPGAMVTQPGQAAGASTSRPGAATGPAPTAFQNPYGLPEPIQPPVVNPNANPYGLPNPVKPPTPAPTPTPTGPIKKSDGSGGQN